VGLLIDSSVFIEAERGRLALEPKIEGRRDEPVALSALTASELLHGVHRASSTRRRLERERFVEAILLRFPWWSSGWRPRGFTPGSGRTWWAAGG
jgi:tRNA(fMet)-specific endonuclease VapC